MLSFRFCGEEDLELLDDQLDLLHVGIDGEGSLEVRQGALGLAQLEIDLPVAGERAEVDGVALHHLVAIVEGLVVLAHEVVDGRPLVPALRELGLPLDDAGEDRDRGGALAQAQLLDAQREEGVHLGVARAAPHPPERVLGEGAHDDVGVAQGLHEGGHVLHPAGIAEPGGGQAARLDLGAAEVGERLLAAERRGGLGGGGACSRPGGEEPEDEGGGETAHARPTSARNCGSSRMGTLSRRASSALEPGSSPTTT